MQGDQLSLLFCQFIGDILVDLLADLKNSELARQNLQNLLNTSLDIGQRQYRHFVIPSSFKSHQTQIRELSRVTPVGTRDVPLKSHDGGCFRRRHPNGTELSNKIIGRALKLREKWSCSHRKCFIDKVCHKRLNERVLLRDFINSEAGDS